MSGLFPDSALRDLRRQSERAMRHRARIAKDDPAATPTLDPNTKQPTGTVPEVVVYDGPARVTDDEAVLRRRAAPETDVVGRALVRLPVEVGPLDPEAVRVQVWYRGIERTAFVVEASYESVFTSLLVGWNDVGEETPRDVGEGVPS